MCVILCMLDFRKQKIYATVMGLKYTFFKFVLLLSSWMSFRFVIFVPRHVNTVADKGVLLDFPFHSGYVSGFRGGLKTSDSALLICRPGMMPLVRFSYLNP